MATLMMNGNAIEFFATTQKALAALERIVSDCTAEHCDNYMYYDEDFIKEAIEDWADNEMLAEKAKALLDNFEGNGWYNLYDYAAGHADSLYICGQMSVNLYGAEYEIVED